MKDKKETAVGWLIEQWPILKSQLPERILDHAIKLEKQQIIEAFENGQDNIDSDGCHIDMNGAEQYYNKTYEQ